VRWVECPDGKMRRGNARGRKSETGLGGGSAASAAMHPSPSIMLAAVKFFLGQDTADEEESDDDGDDPNPPVVGPSKSEIYSAKHKVRMRSWQAAFAERSGVVQNRRVPP
jgi:hypothetical protein